MSDTAIITPSVEITIGDDFEKPIYTHANIRVIQTDECGMESFIVRYGETNNYVISYKNGEKPNICLDAETVDLLVRARIDDICVRKYLNEVNAAKLYKAGKKVPDIKWIHENLAELPTDKTTIKELLTFIRRYGLITKQHFTEIIDNILRDFGEIKYHDGKKLSENGIIDYDYNFYYDCDGDKLLRMKKFDEYEDREKADFEKDDFELENEDLRNMEPMDISDDDNFDEYLGFMENLSDNYVDTDDFKDMKPVSELLATEPLKTEGDDDEP